MHRYNSVDYNNIVIQRRSKYGTCYGHFFETQIDYKLFAKVYIDKIGYTVSINVSEACNDLTGYCFQVSYRRNL